MADQTLQILIDVRSRLDDVVKAQAEFRKMREEVTSTGFALKAGFAIDIARRGLDLLTGSLKQAVFESFRLAGQIKDGSEALGISATAYQILTLEMRDAGVDAGRLTMAISTQTQSLAAARLPASEMAQAYRDLGLSAAAVELLPVEERLIAVARAALSAKDQTLAFDAAGKIIGSRGLPQFLNALRKLSSEGVPALQKTYEAQGLIMNDDTVERLDRAEKSWGKLWRAIVIGSGEAVATLDKFRVSAGKDLWGTIGDLIKSGPLGMNSGDLIARMAIDNPEAAKKAPGDPRAIIEAQAAAAARLAATDVAKAQAAANATAAENAAKRSIEVGEWRSQLSREHVDQLNAEGDAIRKSVMTPTEEYAAVVGRLNQLHEQGVIGFATFQRAVGMASDDLDKKTAVPEETKPQDRWRRPEGAGEGAMAWMNNVGSASQQVADTIQGTLGSAVQGISDGIYGWITGTQTFGDAMLQLGNSVFRTILDTIVQMGVQFVLSHTLMRGAMTTTGVLDGTLRGSRIIGATAEGTATATAMAPAAALSSISSFGLAAALGIAALVAAMAAFGGFAQGGVVSGPGTGTSDSIIARVSNGEGILTAATVSRLGPGFVDAVNAGAPVSVAASAAPALAGGAAAPAAAGAGGGNVSVAVFLDETSAMAWLGSRTGKKILYRKLGADRGELGLET